MSVARSHSSTAPGALPQSANKPHGAMPPTIRVARSATQPAGQPRPSPRRRVGLAWMGRQRDPAIRWLMVVAGAVLLEVAVRERWVSPLFVASPTSALQAVWVGMTEGDYVTRLGITLAETGAAFGGAAVVGTLLGHALWRTPRFSRAYEPILYALASAPIVLLYPVALVIVGRNPVAVSVLGFVSGLLPILITTQQAFAQVRPVYLKVAQMNQLSSWQTFRRILLPAALPGVVVGLRLGLTFTLLTVLAMEFLTDVGGVGAEISDAYSRLRSDEMYGALLLVVALSVLFLFIVERLTRLMVRQR